MALEYEPQIPDIDVLHKDIALANHYRIEVIKYCILSSTALLAFTVSFRPKLETPVCDVLMWISWFSLALSIMGGVGNMYGWENFYISYRDFDFKTKGVEGKAMRKRITFLRRVSMFFQFSGLSLGVMTIALYFALNMDKVASQ